MKEHVEIWVAEDGKTEQAARQTFLSQLASDHADRWKDQQPVFLMSAGAVTHSTSRVRVCPLLGLGGGGSLAPMF